MTLTTEQLITAGKIGATKFRLLADLEKLHTNENGCIIEHEEYKNEKANIELICRLARERLEAVTFQEKVSPIALYDISVRFGISYEELMEIFGHVVPSNKGRGTQQMSEVTLTTALIKKAMAQLKQHDERSITVEREMYSGLLTLALERLDMERASSQAMTLLRQAFMVRAAPRGR